MLTARLDELRSLPLSWRDRWVAVAAGADLPVSELAVLGQSIFDQAVLPPLAVIREDRLDHNIGVLQSYCDRHGVLLAPHAKTTMAPEIWRRQLEAGAWGLTAATVSQARIMALFGVQRVLIANEVVDPAAIEWLASTTTPDSGVEVMCLVDSLDAVRLLDDGARASGAQETLPVLVEIGMVGGRTGCRTIAEARFVAEAIAKTQTLRLVGVECFEGLVDHPTFDERAVAVDEYLVDVARTIEELIQRGLFESEEEVLVSAGGSAYFDSVVEHLAPARFSMPATLLLRCGCYVVHDCELYEDSSPLGARGSGQEGRLAAALEVWATVLSRPEPSLAICGLGKRDTSEDSLPPQPRALIANGEVVPAPPHWTVERLMDHHAFLEIDESDALAVGDWIGFGINHPCTTFDRWPTIALVDKDYTIRDVIRTIF